MKQLMENWKRYLLVENSFDAMGKFFRKDHAERIKELENDVAQRAKNLSTVFKKIKAGGSDNKVIDQQDLEHARFMLKAAQEHLKKMKEIENQLLNQALASTDKSRKEYNKAMSDLKQAKGDHASLEDAHAQWMKELEQNIQKFQQKNKQYHKAQDAGTFITGIVAQTFAQAFASKDHDKQKDSVGMMQKYMDMRKQSKWNEILSWAEELGFTGEI